MPALFRIIAWCRSGAKPLSEPLMHGQFTDAYMRHSASMSVNVSCPQSSQICIRAVYYWLPTILFPSFHSGPTKHIYDAFNLGNKCSEKHQHQSLGKTCITWTRSSHHHWIDTRCVRDTGLAIYSRPCSLVYIGEFSAVTDLSCIQAWLGGREYDTSRQGPGGLLLLG